MKNCEAVLCATCVVLLLLTGSALKVQGAESPKTPIRSSEWADDLDPHGLDIDSIRKQYSLWGLLSKAVVRRDLGGNVRAEVAPINALTYVHLHDQMSAIRDEPDVLKKKLEKIYVDSTLFYIVLKSETNLEQISSDDWLVKLKNNKGREVTAKRLEATKPELRYGDKGNFYQKTIFAYFSREPDMRDALKGWSLVLSNERGKIETEFSWATARRSSGRADYLGYHRLIKTLLPALLVILTALTILTRPRKAWRYTGV